jgi:hypothetical protein
MATATTGQAGQQPIASRAPLKAIRIYEHSDMVYWWAIWFAALVCMFLTYFFGERILIGDKAVYVHSSPWVGIGFLVIQFATLIFTHLRARGIYAVIMVLALALVGLIVHLIIGWAFVWDLVSLVRVHMNLAYYVVVFFVSFVLWVYIALIHPNFTYGVVRPGEIGWHSPLTGRVESYRPLNFQVVRRSDDIVVHGILGLKFLGLGTGDIEVRFDTPGGGSQHHTFHNVWRPDSKVSRMEALIAAEVAA